MTSPISRKLAGELKRERVAGLIVSLRKRLDLTQEEFAQRCGVDRTRICHIENRRNGATSFAMCAAIAKGAGLSADQLHAYLSGELGLDEIAPVTESHPVAA